jgi:hypothetical protein
MKFVCQIFAAICGGLAVYTALNGQVPLAGVATFGLIIWLINERNAE